ncbi:MAG: penicillin-binding protein 2 [Candidatus Omnitrophica bacterium]|nr:penicillin-binding protein 2 [Candidatus Omnitrophota bacterium]
MRTHIIRNIIIALFFIITIDLFYMQVIRGGYFFRQSETNSIRIIPFEGKRGRILDRNGKVLADNKKSFCVTIIPQDQKDKKEVFHFLARVLGLEAAGLEARFKKNKLTPFSPVIVAEGITRQQAIMIEESSYQYPGLLVLEHYSRYYPFTEMGGHVIGYVGKADEEKMRLIQQYGYSPQDPVGYSGIEQYYDNELRTQPGGRQIQVNSRGQQVRLLSLRQPSEGKDLVLTLDQDIQTAAQKVLASRPGAAVFLDPDNGEVLGLVSSPGFDPNAFSEHEDRSLVVGYLRDTASPLMNRASGAQFPPGSVFKIIVASAALQERKIKPTTVFDCPGYFDLGGRHFTFAHAFGQQDLIQAMGHSANEYFFNTGLDLGRDMIARYAAQFGLDEATGIDIPYEAKGSIPRRNAMARWFAGDTANMSIGQGGVMSTPLQLARLMATVENEGRMVMPHIRKSLGGVDNVAPFTSSRFVVLRPEVWQALKLSLRAVVKMETGTAKILDLPDLLIYGKTGTAQAGPGKGDHAWFAGVVQTAKRKLAFAVLLEHGGSSANACLAVKEILLELQSGGVI